MDESAKQNQRKPTIPAQLNLQPDKVIRSLAFLNSGTQLAIMSYLQVLIMDISHNHIVKTIKRLSPPKAVVSIPNQPYLVIHFSDNYCMMYDTDRFEEIYILVGMPADHRGIKPSDNGRKLLYGNNGGAIQVWNVLSCKIQMMSHQLRFFNVYDINYDGSQLYLGTFNGQVLFVRLILPKQGNVNAKVPYAQQMKVHGKCVMAIEHIDPNTIATIDYNLQCAIITTQKLQRKPNILVKIQPSVTIKKNITFIYSELTDCLYLNVNQLYYRMGVGHHTTLFGKNGMYTVGNRTEKTKSKGEIELINGLFPQSFFVTNMRKEAIFVGVKDKCIAIIDYI